MTVQVFVWPARRDSNPRSSESESAALSSCATGGNIHFMQGAKMHPALLFYLIFSITSPEVGFVLSMNS